jgi:predicted RNA-binding protein with RPS1 domain
LKLSQSKNWNQAKLEWKFESAYIADDCLCGHFPIVEICTIYNVETKKRADIGNHCVKQFLNIEEQESIFVSLRKILKDNTKSVNPQTIKYVFVKQWINLQDYNYYLDIWKKRILSERQAKWKLDINNRIIKGVRK